MASSFSTYYFLALFYFTNQLVHGRLHFQSSNGSEIQSFCSIKCGKLDYDSAEVGIPLHQCSCHPSCPVYGDCCFDSPYRDSIEQPRRDFICLSVVGHDRYKAVSGCPSNEAADFCKDGLGHLPPVTSRSTNVTYANVFCAKCNGDKDDLIKWKVELRCSSNTSAEAKYIYNSGRIWSLNEADGSRILCKYHIQHNDSNFMKGLELRSCNANIRKVSRCSRSWKDANVLQMCRSYEDPVYFQNTAFRNVHCALCNYLNPEFADCIPDHVKKVLEMGVVDSHVKHFCKTRGSDACIQSLADYSKGRSYAFADLMNISEKYCVPPNGRKCCVGEAFDYRSRICRKLRN